MGNQFVRMHTPTASYGTIAHFVGNGIATARIALGILTARCSMGSVP